MEKKILIGLALTILGLFVARSAQAEVYTLWAGQHIDVGTVTMENDSDTLYVIFETSGDWELVETHVHAAIDPADIPQTQPNKKGQGGGNPIPGAFKFSESPTDPTIQTYEISLSEIGDSGFDPEGCNELFVATHAEVICVHYDCVWQIGDVWDWLRFKGLSVQKETAWAGDIDFPGANWATYCNYISQNSCDGIPVYMLISHPSWHCPPVDVPDVDGILLKQVDCGDVGKGSGDYPCYFDCERYTISSNVDVKLRARLYKLCNVRTDWEAYFDGGDIIPGDGEEHEFIVCIKAWRINTAGYDCGDVMQLGCLDITVEPVAP